MFDIKSPCIANNLIQLDYWQIIFEEISCYDILPRETLQVLGS